MHPCTLTLPSLHTQHPHAFHTRAPPQAVRGMWPRVAAHVGSRTAQQCRERFNNVLSPDLDTT
eukprot:234269-Chlamydomonas_euryale.AAC.1